MSAERTDTMIEYVTGKTHGWLSLTRTEIRLKGAYVREWWTIRRNYIDSRGREVTREHEYETEAEARRSFGARKRAMLR